VGSLWLAAYIPLRSPERAARRKTAATVNGPERSAGYQTATTPTVNGPEAAQDEGRERESRVRVDLDFAGAGASLLQRRTHARVQLLTARSGACVCAQRAYCTAAGGVLLEADGGGAGGGLKIDKQHRLVIARRCREMSGWVSCKQIGNMHMHVHLNMLMQLHNTHTHTYGDE